MKTATVLRSGFAAILVSLGATVTSFGDVAQHEYMRIIGSDPKTGACLLTDYVPKSNTVIRTKYASSSSAASDNSQFLFCSRLKAEASTDALNFSFMPNSSGKFRFDYYASQSKAEQSFVANRPYELLVREGKAYVTDTVTGAVTEIGPGQQSFEPQYKLMLFKSYVYNDGAYDGRDNSFHGRFYYLKIYEIEDGVEVLKHNFVPCLEGSTVKLCDIADPDKMRYALTIDSGASVLPPKEFTIEAPGGVGDVAALTNALAAINSMIGDADGRRNAKVYLKPGVYDLSGVYMDTADKSHLLTKDIQGGLIAGLGDGPEDTILLGGGSAEGHRVLYTSGNNYGWMTISNLTVTGGWAASGNGGGIYGNASTRYCHLIVSNNYAKGGSNGGGGGCYLGRAEHCLFAHNRVGGSRFGGAFLTSGGGGQLSDFVQGAWYCTFTNNVSPHHGGALFLKGKCIGCKFLGNSGGYGGAIEIGSVEYNWFSLKFTNTTEVIDCEFEGNTLSVWGHGSAIYNSDSSRLVPISNCVFTANSMMQDGGNGVVCKGDLYDCVVMNNVQKGDIFYYCNLSRCYVADNRDTSNRGLLDRASNSYTNSNCIFLGNVQEGGGVITSGKIIVNCTYVENVTHSGANYGDICRNCRMWNTVLDKNYQTNNKGPDYHVDVRAHYKDGNLPLVMTNCVFGKADSYTKLDSNGYVTNAGVANTRKVDDMRFVDTAKGDYTPKKRSPLCNTGCQEPWILSLVGESDLAENPRVLGARIDIGAYECQDYKSGVMLLIR